MSTDTYETRGNSQFFISVTVIVFSIIIIGAICYGAIINENSDSFSQTTNIIIPLIATWVGTVLAYYFGKDNFESASIQIREITKIQKGSLDLKQCVSTIMKKWGTFSFYQIKDNADDSKISLKDIVKQFTNNETRFPIINTDGSPRYMITANNMYRFLYEKGNENLDTDLSLQDFVNHYKEAKIPRNFGVNSAFVVVAEDDTLETAKKILSRIEFAHDIFVTQKGISTEQVTGWISNNMVLDKLDEQ